MVTRNQPFGYRAFQKSVYYDPVLQPGPINYSSYDLWQNLGTGLQSGSSNPNWRLQIARKVDASTDYTRSTFNGKSLRLHALTSTRATIPSARTITGDDYIHLLYGYGSIYTGDDFALMDSALSRLRRRLATRIGSVEALVPIFEIRELGKLIKQTARLTRDLAEAILTIRRTTGVRAAYRVARRYSHHKALADAWLAWSFGIKPLISDTFAILTAIQDYLDRFDIVARFSGTASKTWFSSNSQTGTGAFGAPYRSSVQLKHTLSYRYTTGIRLLLRSGNNYDIWDHLGFSADALPSALYEAKAFSWIYDYFTTMGEYLSDTFEVPPGSTTFLVRTRRYTMEGQLTGSHVASLGSLVDFDVSSPGFVGYSRLDRTKLTGLPHVGLHFKTADRIATNEVNRLLNLVSVLIGQRRY